MASRIVKITSILVVSVLFVSVLPAVDIDALNQSNQLTDDNMVNSYSVSKHKDYYYSGSHSLDTNCSLGYWSANWSPEYNCWSYGCKVATGFAATGSYGFPSHGMIQAAALDIKVSSNQDNAYVSSILDDDFIWSSVQSTEKSNVSDISLLLAGLVVDALAGPASSFAWSVASELINSLCNGYDRVQNTSKSMWYLWEWIPQINSASQSMCFTTYVKPGEIASFDVKYHVFGQGFELLTAGPITLTLQGVGPQSLCDPSDLSLEERNSYGIDTVSRANLNDYLDIHGYGEEVRVQFENSMESEFYFIPNVEDLVNVDSSESDDLSISSNDYLNEEIRNSEMIIDVFSNASNSSSIESIAIINKHTQKLMDLRQSLSQLYVS